MDSLQIEVQHGYPRLSVAGVDEVGRGCLAGPVVAAAVLLPLNSKFLDPLVHPWLLEVTDSKKIKPKTREELVPKIESWAGAYALGWASVEEIDRINIYHASHLAMLRAVRKLKVRPDRLLVDGNALPKNLPCPATPVVKGDLKCISIGAASILAKVWRDAWMTRLDRKYPGYGLAVHKGYPTPAHSEALRVRGASKIHRRTFAPVAETLPLF